MAFIIKSNADYCSLTATEESVSPLILLLCKIAQYDANGAGASPHMLIGASIRYNTKSNKVRVIKTPGGQLRYLHIKKKGSPPKCGDCGIKLPGVSDIIYIHTERSML
jgi:large subunit ribosomal protein L34e